MKKLEYKIEIDAKPEKIWHKMWDRETYGLWTAERAEGHYYEGELSAGNTVDLYDSEGNGMFNLVENHVANHEIIFKHLGWIYDKERAPQNWENSREKYSVVQGDKGTLLKIEVDALDEFVDYFETNIPKTLKRIKQLCEE